MKKSFKRSIAVILSVLMIVASLPFTALAATGEYKPDVQMQFGTVSDPDFSGDYFNTTFDSSELRYSALYGPALDYSDGTLTLSADKTNGVADSGAAAASEDHTLVVGDYFTATVRLDNISKLAAFSMAIKYSENIEPAGIYDNSGSTELVGLSDVTADMTAYAAAAKPYSYASASKVYSGINGGNVGDLSYINTTDHYIMAEAAATDGSTGVDVSSGSSNGEKLVNPETGDVGYDYVKQVPVATFIFKVVEEGPIEFSIYDSDNSKLPAYTGGFYIADETDGTTVADYTTYATSAESNGSTLLTFNKKNSNNATTTTYKIVFKGADGSVISSKEYEEGATVTIPALPTKDADADYHYSYAWNTTPSATATADATYTAVETRAAHTWDEGVVTKPATSTTEGEKTYTCTVCKHTRTEVIPKTECEHKNTTTSEKVTKEATCREAGSKTVTVTCNDCGKVISTTTVEIPKLEHKFGDWKYNGDAVYTSASNYQNGTETATCSVCGETKTQSVPGTGLLRARGASAEFGAEIVMCIGTRTAQVQQFDEVYCKFIREDGVETDVKASDSYVSGSNTYFNYGITPQGISSPVTVVYYGIRNGHTYWGPSYTYNMATNYVVPQLNKSTSAASYKKMLVELMYYGAAAQVKNSWKTDELMTDLLSDEQKKLHSTDALTLTNVTDTKHVVNENATTTWRSVNVEFGSSTVLLFRTRTLTPTDDLKAVVTVSGEGASREYSYAEHPEYFTDDGAGGIYFRFEELNAHRMRSTVDVTLYKGDAAITNTLRYSLESYAASRKDGTDIKPLTDAMMRFGDAAAAYFA